MGKGSPLHDGMMPENFAFAKVKLVSGYPNKFNNAANQGILSIRLFFAPVEKLSLTFFGDSGMIHPLG